MFADTLNQIITKKSMKENWRIIKILYIKKTIAKCRSLQMKERLLNSRMDQNGK